MKEGHMHSAFTLFPKLYKNDTESFALSCFYKYTGPQVKGKWDQRPEQQDADRWKADLERAAGKQKQLNLYQNTQEA